MHGPWVLGQPNLKPAGTLVLVQVHRINVALIRDEEMSGTGTRSGLIEDGHGSTTR